VITAAIIRVPDSPAELDQWILWRCERSDDGKPTKIPYQINGNRASSTNPNTWCSWDEALKAWARPIIERFFDSYAEISPSRCVIKIWAKGRLPGSGTAFSLGDGRVEIYDQARYFTVTGDHWAGQLLDVEEHQADLDWLLELSPHGQKKVPFIVQGKIPKGSQHDTLVSIAGTMRARM
jgi:putative DNA primase/helicase